MTARSNKAQPVIFIVFGLPGSGKSYFASRWAEKTQASYVNSDMLRKEMFASPGYSRWDKDLVYQRMLLETKKNVEQGRNIVLDGTFYTDHLKKLFEEEIAGNAVLHFIEVTADESVIRERLKEKRLYSEADYNVYIQIKKEWQGLTRRHLVLHSTNNNINEMLLKAERYFTEDKVSSAKFSG
jgi:predicted kinase